MREDIVKLLKRYGIAQNKSIDEIVELLEIKSSEISSQTDIIEISKAIAYLQTEAKNENNYVSELVETDSKQNIDYSVLKNNGAGQKMSTQGMTQGGTQTTHGMTQGSTMSTQGMTTSTQGMTQGSTTQSTSGWTQNYEVPVIKSADEMFFTSTTGNDAVNNLFVRILDDLKYGEFASAGKVVDSIFAIEPRNAGAYLAKFMLKWQIKSTDQLIDIYDPDYSTQVDFKRAYDNSDNEQKAYLDYLLNGQKQRIQYRDADIAEANARTAADYKAVAAKFAVLGNYQDAYARSKSCAEKADRLEADERIRREEEEKHNKLLEEENRARAEEAAKKNRVRNITHGLIRLVIIGVLIAAEIGIYMFCLNLNGYGDYDASDYIAALLIAAIPMVLVGAVGGYLLISVID